MGAGASIDNNDNLEYGNEIIIQYKLNGDFAYKKENWDEAVYYYTKCIIEENNNNNISNIIKSKLYSNRSAAYLENHQYVASFDDALFCIELNPTWPKGYYRAAKSSLFLCNYIEANKYIDKAIAISSNGKMCIELKNKINQYINNNNNNNNNNNEVKINTINNNCKELGCIYSWGANIDGQLGLGKPRSDKSYPTIINDLRGKYITDISCGTSHSIAVTSLGEVYSYGNNKYCQLGLGDRYTDEIYDVPMLIPKLVGIYIIAVSVGAAHTIAISRNNKVYSWGIGMQGQLGLGITNNITEPTLITYLNDIDIVAVDCGIAHSLFLTKDGNLLACGMNNFGQLGLGIKDENYGDGIDNSLIKSGSILIPQPVPKIDNAGNILHIACGGAHTIVIDEFGSVFTCGSNSCGQLGLSNLEDSITFKQVNTTLYLNNDPGAYAACGEEFSCIVTRNRHVYTMGLGLAGQMGDGELNNHSSPKRIESLVGKGIETIMCSQGQVLGLTDKGEIYTWGVSGDNAKMANLNSDVIIKIPQKINSIGKKKIRQLSCGRKHYLCLLYGPYGPFCYTTLTDNIDNFNQDNNNNERYYIAGTKIKFQIQSMDENNEKCLSGGCIFHKIILNEAIDYELKLKKLYNHNNNDIDKEIFEIDDNFDGTYNCEIKLLLLGVYRIKIYLNDLEIKQSPFEINIKEGPIFPPNCFAWFGKFAIKDTAINNDNKGGYGQELYCNCGDAIVFTVSCRDKYNNKCNDTSNHCVIIECYQIIDINNSILISKEDWNGSSLGIFPCAFHSPNEVGKYYLSIGIDNTNNNNSLIKGSNFLLTVNPKIIIDEIPLITTKINEDENEKELIHNNNNNNNNNNIIEIRENKTIELSKLEMTRKRSEDALKKQKKQYELEKEERRKKKSIKRTGGGFLLQYSKEI